MFTLASLHPLLTEPLPIPPLSLAGRVPPTNATIALDTSGYAAELSLWPEFHNGVAAGLRLASGVTNLTRTWIVYNKPNAPDYSHAGLLMALGLHDHLTALAMTDIFVYLSQGHDATSVGVRLLQIVLSATLMLVARMLGVAGYGYGKARNDGSGHQQDAVSAYPLATSSTVRRDGCTCNRTDCCHTWRRLAVSGQKQA